MNPLIVLSLFSLATLPAARASTGELIGIDLGTRSDGASHNTPTNWNHIACTSFDPPYVLENLIDESGAVTEVDITLPFGHGARAQNTDVHPGQTPVHTPPLA